MKLSCVLMAAGAGVRFGGNKLRAEFRGTPLYALALAAVPASCLSSVAVVSGDPVILSSAGEAGFIPVLNGSPELGASLTIRLGLEAVGDCDACMFMVADQPLLKRQTAARLVREYERCPGGILAPAYRGRRGNPVIFSSVFFPELMALEGECGGSRVIQSHGDSLALLEADPLELNDVDSIEALHALEGKQ